MDKPDPNPIINKVNLHSCLVRQGRYGSAVIVKERRQRQDGTIEPAIVTYKNPKRSFYVTKERFRSHKHSKEYEEIGKLDKYTCHDFEMINSLADVLGIFRGGGTWIDPHKLYRSQYVYGADINIESLIKMRYMNMYPSASIKPVAGFLDIETSIDTGEIILISFVHGTTVHTAALRAFCFKEEGGKRIAFHEDEIIRMCKENLAERTKGINYTYDFKIFDKEIEIIAWIFKMIHLSHVDFVGIWNLDFDIPYIIDSIQKHEYSPSMFFSHPDVPKELRYFRYIKDKAEKLAHFTLKWHKTLSTGTAQFVDSMCLFSHCRKTSPFRGKYTLESVLQDFLDLGKLPLEGGSHTIMQRHKFPEYCVYNVFDVVGMDLLERKNQDITALTVLAGATPVMKFNHMTERSKNSLYHDLINKGKVLKSYSKDDDFTKFDKLFPNTGGSVLDPSRVQGVGVVLDY